MASKIAADVPSQADLEIVQGGFVTVEEAKDYLRVCRAKVYALMEAGELPYAKVGKSRRIPRAALHAYAAACLRR
jgi:excisionase family DNA binding protein